MTMSELNVAVVEDDDFQRKMIVKLVQLLNISSVFGAADGQQAMEIIRGRNGNAIDIVISDLNMPGMDGLEFLRKLGEEHHNIAIVIISALGGKLLTSAGKMARMYGIKLLGVIEKPITKGQLEKLLAKYERSENKWQQPDVSSSFTLEEILGGIHERQFEPFLQPKIDLKTGMVVGMEALARWIHPEKQVVGPFAFIPQLEVNGMIDDLTFLMIEKSAAACCAVHDKGYLLTVSVNLSLVSLSDTALADKITRLVKKTGLSPRYVTLEITETAAMTDVAHALENLARLCMNGFTLSIDDYGTGYSSLQQLTRIPFGELKIDQSFVKDLADNEASRIVIESSIDMARRLKVRSVAEGVETQQDWDMLKRAGCDIAQGYFIAKPMDLGSFQQFCGKGLAQQFY